MSFDTAPIFELQISTIIIPDDRQRASTEADAGLISSIEQRGLINPIIVRGGNILVAGGRRLDAHKKLSRLTIPARNIEDMSEDDAILIELQENLQRENLPWQDEARAVLTYHEFMVKRHAGWTQLGTANNIGMSDTGVSKRLLVARELSDEKVAGCQTLQAALNYLESKAQRAVAAAQAAGFQFTDVVGALFNPTEAPSKETTTEDIVGEILGNKPISAPLSSTASLLEAGKQAAALMKERRESAPAERQPSGPIINADFLEWAASYTGELFDVIHCDFPYGKNYKGANTTLQAEHATPVYDDSAEVLFTLLHGFLELQNKIVAPAAHCIFWHDRLHEAAIIDAFTKAGWKHCSPYPLIWTKGNAGSPGDYKNGFRHCYEQAHLFSRGGRTLIKQGMPDHFACPLEDEKLHLSQKPVNMLKYFLAPICDEYTKLLDPTCGSGSAIAAANLLQIDYAVGIEMDEANAQVANFFVSRRLAEEPGK